jgi:CRISPR-associated endonuclease/helicase Cas3
LRPFQAEVAASTSPITFVRAGCGTGKTLAAYQWAAEQHPTRQLWITYPTTGTATEGFRDYLQPTDVPARLEHGRAEVDVDIFHLRDGDAGARELDRLDALRGWGADVIACTVDTVLGLVQCQRRGTYAWPGLSHGAVVFDEVHAYDDALFGSLLRFLEALPGIPTLLMTASLPNARREAIEALCLRVHGRPLAVVEGPAELEELPRYRLEESEDPWTAVNASLADRGKVLWVSNTVNRCMEVADVAPAGCDLRVYHSRFRYVDRVRRHRDVVAAFKDANAVLATTTQVAEMSLDLSADLLVTDLAPIPAMIQRLGRLNRRSTPERPLPVRTCLVRATPRPAPYEQAQLEEARAWLSSLHGRPLCQRELIDAWEQAPSGVKRTSSTWLDGGFHTEAAALREASVGMTVLLPDDARAVRRRQARAIEVALPMGSPPRGLDVRAWPRESFLPIAPEGTISYDQNRGGRWRS